MAHLLPRAGRFVWHDLMASDLPTQQEFYTRLFPWTLREHPVGDRAVYTYIHTGGHDVGGIQSVGASGRSASHWLCYVTVDDIDLACTTAARVGGEVIEPPTDIPGVGRFAIVSDAVRALVAPIQWDAPPPERDPGPPAPGTFCWNELLTLAPKRAADFYAELCRWTRRELDLGGERSYWIFVRGGERDAAGMMKTPPGLETRPIWVPYIATADVDGSVDLARDLGATILAEPADIPDIGRFAVLSDPAGAMFAMFRGA